MAKISPARKSNEVLPAKEEFEEWAFRKIVSALDTRGVRKSYEGDFEQVQKAENRLVDNFRTSFREYLLDIYLPIMTSAMVVAVLFNEFIQPISYQAVGVISVLIGAFTMGANTAKGPVMIAVQGEGRGELHLETLANQTARTTAGLVAFLTGFGIQLLVISPLYTALILGGILAWSLWGWYNDGK